MKIGYEIWNAVSDSQGILEPGDEIVVKDRHGLIICGKGLLTNHLRGTGFPLVAPNQPLNSTFALINKAHKL